MKLVSEEEELLAEEQESEPIGIEERGEDDQEKFQTSETLDLEEDVFTKTENLYNTPKGFMSLRDWRKVSIRKNFQ